MLCSRSGRFTALTLENPEEARKTFQQFLDKYPKSSKAEEAQAKIKEIDQLLAERAATKSAPRREAAENRRSSGLPEVTAVRRWVGPNYSRIVIGVDGEVKFETSRLSNPDRIVLDIENTRLSPALVGKTFPVEDGFLRQIRVGQFTATVTRVVLDVEKIEDYSVLPLPNPFRLVVDIHGATVTGQETERAAKESTRSARQRRPRSGRRKAQPQRGSPPAAARRPRNLKPPRATQSPSLSPRQPERQERPRRRRRSRRHPSSRSKRLRLPARRKRELSNPRR